MTNEAGPALSDAATYADSAVRLLVAAFLCVDEARQLEPGLEHRLLTTGQLFGEKSQTAADQFASSDGDASPNLSAIPSEGLNEFERTLLEDIIEYADYLQRLADQFGHEEVRRRLVVAEG